MKIRDSGMPEEDMWAGFFDPKMVVVVISLAPYHFGVTARKPNLG
jgi:hypothetical protein